MVRMHLLTTMKHNLFPGQMIELLLQTPDGLGGACHQAGHMNGVGTDPVIAEPSDADILAPDLQLLSLPHGTFTISNSGE